VKREEKEKINSIVKEGSSRRRGREVAEGGGGTKTRKEDI